MHDALGARGVTGQQPGRTAARPPAAKRAGPILAAAAAAGLLLAFVFGRVELRTDMAEFLPGGQTEAARFMLREVRQGAAASLILVGLEGAEPAELARLSHAVAASLDGSGLFAFVANGRRAVAEADERFLFEHRYLLSPATTEAAFTAPALRQRLEGLLAGLRSSAAPLVSRYGVADPPGAFLEVVRLWAGDGGVRTVDGAWFAPGMDRALLLAKTRATGMDVGAQDRVAAALDAAFAAARPGAARLLAAGPAVFARDAAHAIRADVELLSAVSAALVLGLLWWRFRSPLVIAAIAVPVVLGVAAAAATVQAVYGFVHGVAFGFGMTMLGVTVDYPVLLIGHRKPGEPGPATLARIGPAFRLAVLTAALGLTGMVFSGFPGLSQLGLFSAVGVLAAAAATWFVLPRLIVAAGLAPVSAGDPVRLLRVERLRAGRLWAIPPVLAATVYLVWIGGPRWETDLANLSPVPEAARRLDEELRRQIGAPDVSQLAVVRAADAEGVLLRQEALAPLLDRLRAEGVIAGAEFAARLLPSQATQRARRAALPDRDALAARLEEARAGLPFRAEAFRPFLDDVAASRAMAPVTLADLRGAAAVRLEPLLFERDGAWYGPVAFQGVQDAARLHAALLGEVGPAPDVAPGATSPSATSLGTTSPGITSQGAASQGAASQGAASQGATSAITYVDMRAEANGVVTAYTGQAWRWLAFGAVAALLALVLGLRDPARTARVVVAVAAAVVVTVAALALLGERLSLIHLVALQFVVGVGLDYALFFARRQLDRDERARTLRTLVTCCATTLLTFGLLLLCRTPLLRDIGATVAIGVLAAMCFAFVLAGVKPGEEDAG